jgi:DNA-binding transcriptional regulator LsrR (DeoR family)
MIIEYLSPEDPRFDLLCIRDKALIYWQCDWDIEAIADELDVSRRKVSNWIDEYELERAA